MPDSNQSELVSVNCEDFSDPLLKLAYFIEDQTVQLKLRRNIRYVVHGTQVN